MIDNNRVVGLSFTILCTIVFLISFTAPGNAQTLYSCESPFGGSHPFFHTLDPNTGESLSTMEITLAGETVRGCNGMARDPVTGVCYIMINIDPNQSEPVPPRVLATIDEETGIATAIGNPEQTFAAIAFTSNGTLYGVTGDGGPTPETLFTINKNNGLTTLVTPLGNGNDGETIAFNPANGLIYHGSGNCLPNQIFESINPQTLQIIPIPLQGDLEICEQSAMVYRSNNVFLTGTIDKEFYSITTDGLVTFLGDNMDHVSKGLAFDCGVQFATGIPTLSEWGLITMAGILGILGIMVLRRRKATV